MKKHHHPGCPCHDHGRRDFLKVGAATAVGLLLPRSGYAANNIRELQGTVFVNRQLADLSTPIQPGDVVTVAHGGKLSFVFNQDAYVLRGGSSLQLEGSDSLVVKGLRLLTGGLLAVFGSGEKTIRTRSTTLGIRGTGIYLDTMPDKTYFCTCYGRVELQAEGLDKRIVEATHHQSAWIHTPYAGQCTVDKMGSWMGEYKYHNDDELRRAEALVGRTVPFDS